MKYLLILLLLVSCGTRKVESEKLGSIEVNNTYSNGSKIVLGTNLTFTPFDNLKPFKVDGKEYNNVIVSNATTKVVEKWKIKIIYRTKTIYRTKIIEKTDHTILYTSMFFIACLFIFLWFYLKKFNLAR
jgi:hypothetical protein